MNFKVNVCDTYFYFCLIRITIQGHLIVLPSLKAIKGNIYLISKNQSSYFYDFVLCKVLYVCEL